MLFLRLGLSTRGPVAPSNGQVDVLPLGVDGSGFAELEVLCLLWGISQISMRSLVRVGGMRLLSDGGVRWVLHDQRMSTLWGDNFGLRVGHQTQAEPE